MSNRPYLFSKPRCPVCRTELDRWGEEDNYTSMVRTIFIRCKKEDCDYERIKYEKLVLQK